MKIFQPVSPQEKVDFAKNLAVMLRSGITINDALSELADQSDSKAFSDVIKRVQVEVENGTSLSQSFNKEKKVFGSIFVSLIKAGEASGTLQDNLQFLAEWLNRSNDLRREVAAATMYPKLVFGAAVLLGGSLAVFILPKLVPLFVSLDVELPVITKLLLSLSLWVQSYWYYGIMALAALIAGVVYINKFPPIRRVFHSMYLRMPFVGKMFKDYQRALITRLFATLQKSGLSLNESVLIVSEAASNINYQEALKVIHANLLKGTGLSVSMKRFPDLFPNIMISIVSIGENSGSVVQSLDYLSEFYEKEVNTQAKILPTIIEPLLLVFIAVIVGFVALAIIMPIYELTGSL